MQRKALVLGPIALLFEGGNFPRDLPMKHWNTAQNKVWQAIGRKLLIRARLSTLQQTGEAVYKHYGRRVQEDLTT